MQCNSLSEDWESLATNKEKPVQVLRISDKSSQ